MAWGIFYQHPQQSTWDKAPTAAHDDRSLGFVKQYDTHRQQFCSYTAQPAVHPAFKRPLAQSFFQDPAFSPDPKAHPFSPSTDVASFRNVPPKSPAHTFRADTCPAKSQHSDLPPLLAENEIPVSPNPPKQQHDNSSSDAPTQPPTLTKSRLPSIAHIARCLSKSRSYSTPSSQTEKQGISRSGTTSTTSLHAADRGRSGTIRRKLRSRRPSNPVRLDRIDELDESDVSGGRHYLRPSDVTVADYGTKGDVIHKHPNEVFLGPSKVGSTKLQKRKPHAPSQSSQSLRSGQKHHSTTMSTQRYTSLETGTPAEAHGLTHHGFDVQPIASSPPLQLDHASSYSSHSAEATYSTADTSDFSHSTSHHTVDNSLGTGSTDQSEGSNNSHPSITQSHVEQMTQPNPSQKAQDHNPLPPKRHHGSREIDSYSKNRPLPTPPFIPVLDHNSAGYSRYPPHVNANRSHRSPHHSQPPRNWYLPKRLVMPTPLQPPPEPQLQPVWFASSSQHQQQYKAYTHDKHEPIYYQQFTSTQELQQVFREGRKPLRQRSTNYPPNTSLPIYVLPRGTKATSYIDTKREGERRALAKEESLRRKSSMRKNDMS